jgi:hypothetical protein
MAAQIAIDQQPIQLTVENATTGCAACYILRCRPTRHSAAGTRSRHPARIERPTSFRIPGI